MKIIKMDANTGIKRKISKNYFNSDEHLCYNKVFEKMARVAHSETLKITNHKFQFNNSLL
ncbi:MAG: hypothetical protein OEW67_14350 [Cyclobacteriaceae bacterium]|nr:hypothetical protein [Cyclobacteriaceae bacterium]